MKTNVCQTSVLEAFFGGVSFHLVVCLYLVTYLQHTHMQTHTQCKDETTEE